MPACALSIAERMVLSSVNLMVGGGYSSISSGGGPWTVMNSWPGGQRPTEHIGIHGIHDDHSLVRIHYRIDAYIQIQGACQVGCGRLQPLKTPNVTGQHRRHRKRAANRIAVRLAVHQVEQPAAPVGGQECQEVVLRHTASPW